MKNKKGFTLIELLAVIVVLAIIMAIAVPNVLNTIKDSKAKAKYIAAKEIVEIAAAYMEKEGCKCVKVEDLINGKYLESDVTNPETGENTSSNINHIVKKDPSATEQDGFELQSSDSKQYSFKGYIYSMSESSCDSES